MRLVGGDADVVVQVELPHELTTMVGSMLRPTTAGSCSDHLATWPAGCPTLSSCVFPNESGLIMPTLKAVAPRYERRGIGPSSIAGGGDRQVGEDEERDA